MVFEKVLVSSEDLLVGRSADYIEHAVVTFQQRSPGNFLLGLSGTNGHIRRARASEVFTKLARSEIIDWSRMRVFLVDERFGVEDALLNEHLVRNSLLQTLITRGVDFADSHFIRPDRRLAKQTDCAADYELRLVRLIESEGRNGPDLVTLGLADDLSIASIFPDWYVNNANLWQQATDKKIRILCTETSRYAEAPLRICVNLRLLRMSKAVVLYVGKGKEDNLNQILEWGDVGIGSRSPLNVNRPSYAGAMADVAAFGQVEGYPSPSRLSAAMPTSEDAAIPAASEEMEPVAPSPLLYLLKYNKDVIIMQFKQDDVNHVSFVVLGAAGDLAKKKTFPSLFQLHLGRVLPSSFTIVAVDNSEYPPNADVTSTDELWERRLQPNFASGCESADLISFRANLAFKHMNFATAPETVKDVNRFIRDSCGGRLRDNRIFYLALPPFLFASAVEQLRQHCWSDTGFNRVIVEKPFGRDLASARELSDGLVKHLEEAQIYRIDHYLAKTMTMNILTLRFANREFGRLFHADNVANVRITFKEDIGVEGRAGYFDSYGIIRDIMQNHLLQLLTLVAMEAPASLDAEDVRDEKVKVLKQIRPATLDDCVVGQYDGYQDDPQIQAINAQRGRKSVCPTFATVILYLDNERWTGVPFILKAAKAVEQRCTLIRLQFKKSPPNSLFGAQPQNELIMRVQPDEAIYYKVLAKTPGLCSKSHEVRRTVLDMDLKKSFEVARFPEAYEKLIHDVIEGERHNFVRGDEVEQGWRIFDPLLRDLEAGDRPVPDVYAQGSRGPPAYHELIDRAGFRRYTSTGHPGRSVHDFQ
jgi:glucose-6-phosphate 1-dehydrogenase|eukprot:TRINITY_DN68906_c0_g1_i1.p1 TRINITY_DN68906_c0_g1~~TRINITY_DN68906_c0_g1_i1.p1  ORF type:complete len:835 (+),score=134.13 TRINITY_DN68906_c0_g1_i1:62-2506(+)